MVLMTHMESFLFSPAEKNMLTSPSPSMSPNIVWHHHRSSYRTRKLSYSSVLSHSLSNTSTTMPLGIYLVGPTGRKPATLATHFSLHDFRNLIEKKIGNPDYFDYSLGDVIFRTWDEEAFNRQRSAIHDGVTIIAQYPPIALDKSDQDVPVWRQASSGLSLEGVCLNVKCEAFEQKVIVNKGIGKFDVITTTVKCPLCDTLIHPIGCAFNHCSWRMTGVKRDDSNLPQSTDWQDVDNNYHRWTDSIPSWAQLIIETKK